MSTPSHGSPKNIAVRPALDRPIPHRVIGIVGGLGPYAHLDLERKLLQAARDLAGAAADQDYPEWILSSVPQTPDRTKAILETSAADPFPWLQRSLRRLEPGFDRQGHEVPGADFVVIACNTAHHYLHRLQETTTLPIWDMIECCAEHIAGRLEPNSRIGILATTGTLVSGLYHRPLLDRKLQPVSLLDAADGERLQQEWVMEPIYGCAERRIRGLKAGGETGAERQALHNAAEALVMDLGCRALILACTEIALALPGDRILQVPIFDPVRVICEQAVAYAYGLDQGPTDRNEQSETLEE